MTKETNQKELYWGDCKHCYDVFLTQSRKKKYCSDACKQQAYRERKKRRQIQIIFIGVEKKPSLMMRFVTLLKKFADIPF